MIMQNNEGLNQVVTDKLQKYVRGNQSNVEQTINQFQEQGKMMEDYMVNIGEQNRNTIEFVTDGGLYANFYGRGFKLHSNALYQLAERFQIPVKFMKRLIKSNEPWEKEMLNEILNYHADNLDKRLLVRTVGDEARAFLSDRYRPLDTRIILESFMNEIQQMGGVLADAHLDETRIWIEALHPEPITIDTPKNGRIVLAYGAQLANSDFGDGALQMRSFLLQGICVNGWVSRNNIRAVHLGKKLPDNVHFSQETYRLDSETMSSAIKDHVKGIFDKDTVNKRIEEINRASDKEVDIKTELEGMFKEGKLLKEEKEGVEKVLMQGDPNNGTQGEDSLFKLSQALTRKAQDFEPRRMREVQEIAGNMIH